LFDDIGKLIQKEGNEFGATTGRPRRCGWLDLPSLKYTIMINGVTQLFMMKADVLNVLNEVKVCTHYKLPGGEKTKNFPFEIETSKIEPDYKTFKGWHQNLKEIKDFETLPVELQDYILFLEEELNVPINIISTGPDRTQTIIRSEVIA
jgi:adenylosuccinate synthase